MKQTDVCTPLNVDDHRSKPETNGIIKGVMAHEELQSLSEYSVSSNEDSC